MIERSLHARCRSCAGFAAGGPRPFALPGTERVYERPRPFKVRHIALDLALDIPGKAVSGTASLDIERIDKTAQEIALDAVGFEISRVEVNGKACSFVYDGDVLRVPIAKSDEKARILIDYRAIPRRGLYFLAPDEHVRDRPNQVWSQCQDEDARFWFPCHDAPHVKQTLELSVKVPAGWYALSNGALVSSEKGQDSWHYRWKMDEPLPSYLVTLAAGEFAEIDGGKADGIPLTYLVPKGREADGHRTFARTGAMIENFGKLTGVKYPWNKYAQVVVSDFVFGGMENTSATTLYEHVLLDERAAIDITGDDLIAHELAHQWFGDYVTCRDFAHGWLNEGFATFFEHLDREAKDGRDEYEYGLNTDLGSYLAEANGQYRRPIVCRDYEAPIDIFDRHLYEKGSLVLHMLRIKLGDEVFWRSVNTYLQRHAHSVVETRDLLRAMEDVSGHALEHFFDQWVHSPGHPELTVKIEHEGDVLDVHVEQTQKPSDKKAGGADVPIFAFDLVLEIAGPDGTVRREVRRIERARETIAIAQKGRPRYVVVDPEMAVVADVHLEAPLDMLRNQVSEAKTARGRWLACGPLGKKSDPPALESLASALMKDDEYWGVRVEAAHALAETRLEAALAILEKAVTIAHPKVRRAVVQGLGKFKTEASAKALRKLALGDASYLVEADAARALGNTRQTSAFETLLDVLDRPAWGDVVRAGALDGLSALRDERAVPHVLARTRYGISTRGRRAAVLALSKLASDRKSREALEELLDDADPHLRADVVRALLELGDTKSRGALEHRLQVEHDGRVRRKLREALRDLGAGSRQERERLRDDLDKLQRDHAELAAKVAKLEAALKRD